jgi:hypothetical protein
MVPVATVSSSVMAVKLIASLELINTCASASSEREQVNNNIK